MNRVFDTTLVEAAVRGETAAIDSLLIVCQPDLTKFAHRVCATPEDAEDAVQETLWIVSRKIGTLRTASAFVSWAILIVKRECYRLLRRDMNRNENVINDDAPYFSEDAEHQIALKDDVIAAIEGLPPKFRKVIILRDIEERSAPEVAALLGLSTEAVKSRLHRGRTLLRAHLSHWAAG